MSASEILTVTQAVQAARGLLESRFASVAVTGEVTGFKVSGPGHMYFSLKDEKSLLPCVFFRSANAALAFKPEDGLKAVATGTLTLYEVRGQFQLNVRSLEPQGWGAQQLRFEQLKRRLSEEGLFDESRKRPLPAFPRRVALVTSPQGAALHDFHRLLQDRISVESVELFPVKVQGPEAPAEIAQALARAGNDPSFDVLVLTRGGGSLEDLSAFNDEAVVRALAACVVPTICAVGHEIDFTLCDFAADRRAATPSAAAALLGPSRREAMESLADLTGRLGSAVRARIRDGGRQTDDLGARLAARDPRRVLEQSRQRLDEACADLDRCGRAIVEERARALKALATALRLAHPRSRIRPARERLKGMSVALVRSLRVHLRDLGRSLEGAKARLDAYHPLSPLKRGYAVVTRERDGRILRDAAEAPPGERLRIRLHRGELGAKVESQRRGAGDASVQKGKDGLS